MLLCVHIIKRMTAKYVTTICQAHVGVSSGVRGALGKMRTCIPYCRCRGSSHSITRMYVRAGGFSLSPHVRRVTE